VDAKINGNATSGSTVLWSHSRINHPLTGVV
jgi:hypothetical protein